MIGPRALLLEELSRLKAQSRRIRREASIWEADQYDGRSDCEKLKACNSCFPLQLDHYKLTSAFLVVRRTHQSMCCCIPVGGVFGAVRQTQNSMDLSQIKDIDTSTVETGALCWAKGARSPSPARLSVPTAGFKHIIPLHLIACSLAQGTMRCTCRRRGLTRTTTRCCGCRCGRGTRSCRPSAMRWRRTRCRCAQIASPRATAPKKAAECPAADLLLFFFAQAMVRL